MSGTRDEYLARLDGAIRRMHGETWNDEAAKKHLLAGLVMARHLYAHPDQLRYKHADELAEALDGSLLDESEPLPGQHKPPDSAEAHDARLAAGWSTWEGGRDWILGMWPGEKLSPDDHGHAHPEGGFFNHKHRDGRVPHDHAPGDKAVKSLWESACTRSSAGD